ncbi:hypothetical protein, partial [Alistipes indistinctus]|uniref:hypothetical protein n=1 Tax=Alistipes indistinctus TaxID=626932 RepID=UPI0039F57267
STFNRLRAGFNMREHIARGTFSGWMTIHPLKGRPRNVFGRRAGSPKSNLSGKREQERKMKSTV